MVSNIKKFLKNKNMKQILSLALTLLPCLAYAQYPSNGNQKITLGEQTTADGLIWRGVASIDTVTATSKITRTNKQDTSAFLLLDTVTNLLWHYKIGSNGWSQAGGSTFDTTTLNLVSRFATKLNIGDTASMLTNYYRSGRTGIIQASDVPTLNQNTTGSAATLTTSRTFQTNLASTSTASFNGSANVTPGVTGTLPVANGGTNRTTMPAGYILHGDGTSVDTAIGLFWDRTNSRLGVGLNSPTRNLHIQGAASSIMRIEASNTNGEPSFELYGKNSSGTQRVFIFKYDNAELFRLGTDQNVPMRFETSDIPRLYIKGTGEIGIGTEDPTQKLHVVGNARITAMNGIGDIGADANGVLQAATSDMNLKNTIENSPFGLNEILLLNPVTFLYNDTDRKIDSDVKEVGFIAQDVFDIIPNAVSSTGTGDLQLDYRAITATLVKAIQEQNSLIKALEQRIINLENK
jgi:hypothetical protein